MATKLSGKIAVVSGSSKGIGASIARHLAAEGATVVVNYSSSKKEADAVVADIVGKGGKASALQGNFSKEGDITRFFDEVKKAHGKVDILINNAGVFEFLPLENVTVEHFQRQFDLNVMGLLLATREAVKLFPATGGAIVNISSVVATAAPANGSVYSATKGAVDTITRSLAKELGPRKIRVNSLSPGMVETEGFHAAGISGSDFQKKVESETPLGRIGQPEDIARVAVFLASPDSGWVTGEVINVSGGNR